RLLELLRVAEAPRDMARLGLLLGQDERDRRPVSAGAAGTSCAVDVALVLVRWIEVDDVRDVDEVETARGHVGRDENRDLAALEATKGTLTRALRHVPVHCDRVDASAREPLHEPVGAALRAHEDERDAV